MRDAALLIAFLFTAVSAGYSTQEHGTHGASAQKQEQVAKATDPVCGMQVDPAKAAGKSEYKGKSYYFCSGHCKKTFDVNPEAVLTKDSKKK